jgi:hypothetical protein
MRSLFKSITLMKLQLLIPLILEYNILDGWIKKRHVIEDENRSSSLMCKLVAVSRR